MIGGYKKKLDVNDSYKIEADISKIRIVDMIVN
jgi:hypothetical protein